MGNLYKYYFVYVLALIGTLTPHYARSQQCTKYLTTSTKNPVRSSEQIRTLNQNLFLQIKIAKKYQNISLLVADLAASKVKTRDLAGEIFKLPEGLGLRSTLADGRIVRFETPLRKKQGVVFLVGGLFNGAEKILSHQSFIKQQTQKGFDVIYLEMTQGYVAAKEILNNNNKSPSNIPYQEQQSLLAYYILRSIDKYNISQGTPKFLLGHSYGGWLVNSFASQAQFNGRLPLQNPYLAKMSERLFKKGLLLQPRFEGVLQAIVPMDAGLGSLHLHPAMSLAVRYFPLDAWMPMARITEDMTLAYVMRQSLLSESPQLKNDPHGVNNVIALFLGIRSQNVVNAPKEIPLETQIFNIIAGQSELIPEAWHRYYSYALNQTSKGPMHRSSIIIENAPHDFLYMKNLGSLLHQLLTGKWALTEETTRITLD